MAHVATNNRSTTYRFTMDPTNPQDMAQLKALRAFLKGSGKRAQCMGRGFKNDQIRQDYKDRSDIHKADWRVCSNPYQMIKLADAKTWDVYVYERV